MKVIFAGVMVSFFLTTSALGMTEDWDLAAKMSRLSIKTGDAKREELKLPDKEIYGEHARLRFFMRGDDTRYCAMFRQAVADKNAVLQVALANASWASVWESDADNNLLVFDPKNFKNFIFSKHGYSLYSLLYQKAFKKSLSVVFGVRAFDELSKIYEQAAAQSFVPAIVTQISLQIRTSGHSKPGDREALRRLAALGYPEAMLLYGKLLFWDYKSEDPDVKQLGFQYMYKSGLLDVRLNFETATEAADRFCSDYAHARKLSGYIDYAGMRFFTSDVVLVPSQDYFDKFCAPLPPLVLPSKL